jgi:hypothetical protein
MFKPKKKRPSDANELAASIMRDVDVINAKPMPTVKPKKAKPASRSNDKHSARRRWAWVVRLTTHAIMTVDEYFNDHIPHRLNLLIAFRTRYSGSQSRHAISPETYRDLFRCAKDMCFLMTRFFCGELGVYFDEKTQQIEQAQTWQGRFGSTCVQPSQLRLDGRYADLCQMYQAANQAVAHIDSQRVNHSFLVAGDDRRMVAVINWLEELVRDHVYRDAGRDLDSAMALPNNLMTWELRLAIGCAERRHSQNLKVNHSLDDFGAM